MEGQLGALKRRITDASDNGGNISSNRQTKTNKKKTYAEKLGLVNIVRIIQEDTERYNSRDKTKESVQELIKPNYISV